MRVASAHALRTPSAHTALLQKGNHLGRKRRKGGQTPPQEPGDDEQAPFGRPAGLVGEHRHRHAHQITPHQVGHQRAGVARRGSGIMNLHFAAAAVAACALPIVGSAHAVAIPGHGTWSTPWDAASIPEPGTELMLPRGPDLMHTRVSQLGHRSRQSWLDSFYMNQGLTSSNGGGG